MTINMHKEKTMEYKIIKVDNLMNTEEIRSDLPKLIFNTVNDSIYEVKCKLYTEEDIKLLAVRKSEKRVEKELKEKCFFYVEFKNKIIAFAAISRSGKNYCYSWLQVLPEYRNKGFANILSNIRDEYLLKLNVKQVLIESFFFEQTLKFHKSRGFEVYKDQSGLKETIRMIKRF